MYDRKTSKGHSLTRDLIGYMYRTGGQGRVCTDLMHHAGCMTKVWEEREQDREIGREKRPGGDEWPGW